MIIMLVEATTTDALVTKVKEQNYRSAEDIRQKSNNNFLPFFCTDSFCFSATNYERGRRHRCWSAKDVFKVSSMPL
jgi:hypothetical protein